MLCYTSGTTGHPKGVLYEHRSTVLHAMAEVAPDVFDLSARTVALPIVPMFHVAAWGLPFSAAIAGVKLVFSADYRPQILCELMEAERVTHSAGVPTVWLSLIAHVEATGASLGALDLVSIGGSAPPRAMIEWFTGCGIRVGHAWVFRRRGRPRDRAGRLVRHGRRRRHSPRQCHADHRPRQGRHQVRRRVDQLDRARKRRARLRGRRGSRGHRHPSSQMGRTPASARGASGGQRRPTRGDPGPFVRTRRTVVLPDEIVFVDALPHTATGKLLKIALREQYKNHRLPTC